MYPNCSYLERRQHSTPGSTSPAGLSQLHRRGRQRVRGRRPVRPPDLIAAAEAADGRCYGNSQYRVEGKDQRHRPNDGFFASFRKQINKLLIFFFKSGILCNIHLQKISSWSNKQERSLNKPHQRHFYENGFYTHFN
jgi:hypothetical protein